MKDKELRNYLFGEGYDASRQGINIWRWNDPEFYPHLGKLGVMWKSINHLNDRVNILMDDIRKLRDLVDPIIDCSNCGTRLRKSEHKHEE